MKILIAILLCLMAGNLIAGDKIIPVTEWPKVIYLKDRVTTNPTVDECVKAGYRLLRPKPETPEGKQIKSEKIVQDDKDASRAEYKIEYEDIPPPPPPEVLIDVLADKVLFQFTTNGDYRGTIWKDAPK